MNYIYSMPGLQINRQYNYYLFFPFTITRETLPPLPPLTARPWCAAFANLHPGVLLTLQTSLFRLNAVCCSHSSAACVYTVRVPTGVSSNSSVTPINSSMLFTFLSLFKIESVVDKVFGEASETRVDE